MTILVAGIDEAGRGPVIGPLVIAGVLFDKSTIPELRPLGVKDSKLLTPRKREKLEPKILEFAVKHKVLYLSPSTIDDYVINGEKLRKLNWLEATAMAEIIEMLNPNVAYLDASDVNEKRFGLQVQGLVSFPVRVISKHHADRDDPVVGAASILAKVNRDRAVAELRTMYGDFGSGYPSDPHTIRFLCELARSGDYPDYVRKSWKTLKRIQRITEGLHDSSKRGSSIF
ncbi:ribonuclease HII [Candidatus Bathyarchaeota archaeon]|nr:ribonuclease HII [Candidatus Bathyarchaeota archaeon]